MKTRRVMLLATVLLAAAATPWAGEPAGADDDCATLGKVASILAGMRDQDVKRGTATSLLSQFSGSDPQADAIIEQIAGVVYDPASRALDAEILELLTVKACSKGIKEERKP